MMSTCRVCLGYRGLSGAEQGMHVRGQEIRLRRDTGEPGIPATASRQLHGRPWRPGNRLSVRLKLQDDCIGAVWSMDW